MKSKLKIWLQFRPLNKSGDIIRRRRCWARCFHCDKSWFATDTKFINMTTIILNNNATDQRFLCDACVDKLLNNEKDTPNSIY